MNSSVEIWCHNLCYRKSFNICWGGYLQKKAAGTPLPGDHAQRKHGWCFQLFLHAEQTLRGWLLSGFSIFPNIPVSAHLTTCSLFSDPDHLRFKSERWAWHHAERPGARDPQVSRFSWSKDSSVSVHHTWHDGLSQQVTGCIMVAENRWLSQLTRCTQPHRSNDDKYVFQLQKRMKKSQFNVRKQAPSKKVMIITFSPEF